LIHLGENQWSWERTGRLPSRANFLRRDGSLIATANNRHVRISANATPDEQLFVAITHASNLHLYCRNANVQTRIPWKTLYKRTGMFKMTLFGVSAILDVFRF
jgi:hypothetical protein